LTICVRRRAIGGRSRGICLVNFWKFWRA